MSTKANNSESSPSPLEEELQKKAEEKASDNAEANDQNPAVKTPEATATQAVTATGETEGQKIANAVDALRKLYPDMSLEDITAMVSRTYRKANAPESKVAAEASRLIMPAPNKDEEGMIYLKKIKTKISDPQVGPERLRRPADLQKKVEEGDEVTIPARNLNEIAVYTPEDYERMSKPGFGFEREGVTVEVWHKPGDTGTIHED